MKKIRNQDTQSAPLNVQRRNFLSLSIIAGSSLFINQKVSAQSNSRQNDVDLSKEGTLADSLILYSQLLDYVRRFVLQYDIARTEIAKSIAIQRLRQMIDIANSLDNINPRLENLTAQQTQGIIRLIDQVKESELLEDYLKDVKAELLREIKLLDSRFDEISSILLEGGRLIQEAESRADAKKANQGLAKVEEAKQLLSAFRKPRIPLEDLEGYINQKLTTPDDLISVLTVFQEAVKIRFQKNSSLASESEITIFKASFSHTANNNSLLQEGIADVLSRYISSSLQVNIGYWLVIPILTTTADRNARIKFLRDVLRLLKGLRAEQRENCATDLAKIRV
jgi:hypothetical protein